MSSIPVAFGEKIVIRIFDPEVLLRTLTSLVSTQGSISFIMPLSEDLMELCLSQGRPAAVKQQLSILHLKTLSSPEVNIVSIEEPIEMVIEEFNQIGIQPAIGVTFATILKNILRQEPDIIMVGEIRDKETPENAVQSALTGHLVLSTLHTNDAPSSIIRLLDLGIPSFLISSTVIGIVAQRLIRKICPHCKEERRLLDEEMEHLQIVKKPIKVNYGEGCIECRGTGYRGRTAIFEIMELSDKVRTVLSDEIELSALYDIAKADGMINLRQVAVRKMLEGITTYDEVVAMTG